MCLTIYLLTKNRHKMGFLLFGTLWFWILFAVATILIIFFLEKALNDEYHDTGGGVPSTIIILSCITLYYFFGSKQDVYDFLAYMRDYPWFTLGRIVAYVGIGIIWSIFKWYFFLQNKKYHLTKKIEDLGGVDLTTHEISESDIPQAKRNKARIISWMSYWPFSMIWTLINEPVKKMFRFIYTKIEGIFQKMSDSAFKDFKVKKRN